MVSPSCIIFLYLSHSGRIFHLFWCLPWHGSVFNHLLYHWGYWLGISSALVPQKILQVQLMCYTFETRTRFSQEPWRRRKSWFSFAWVLSVAPSSCNPMTKKPKPMKFRPSQDAERCWKHLKATWNTTLNATYIANIATFDLAGSFSVCVPMIGCTHVQKYAVFISFPFPRTGWWSSIDWYWIASTIRSFHSNRLPTG